jgi:hypothetical protein
VQNRNQQYLGNTDLDIMFVSTTVAPAILALAARAFALPSADRRSAVPTSVWESIEAPPAAWVKDDVDSEADEVLELRIQLAQQNMAQFQQVALDVSNLLLLQLQPEAPMAGIWQSACWKESKRHQHDALIRPWHCASKGYFCRTDIPKVRFCGIP